MNISTYVFAFNLSIKIHSPMKVHIYISDVIELICISQPCTEDSFTKRYSLNVIAPILW